jgi:cyclic pyranopterin phosphate synthase
MSHRIPESSLPAASPSASGLTHLDEQGRAHMVSVGHKPETARSARASGRVQMAASTLARITTTDPAQGMSKGDVLQVARLAAIQAVKRTADLIPLCHPLRITGVQVDFVVPSAAPGSAATLREIEIIVEVRAFDRTGVEMEALTAVSIAALTIYDMCKAVDRAMCISAIQLDEKAGGRSGTWQREAKTNDAVK